MTMLQKNGFYEHSSFFGIDGQNSSHSSQLSSVCTFLACTTEQC
jgi:hypothetical protein